MPASSLTQSFAHWLSPALIAWPADRLPPALDPASLSWSLHLAADGVLDAWTATGGVPLSVDPDGLSADDLAREPRVAGGIALRVPDDVDVREALKGRLVVTCRKSNGTLVGASELQIGCVLDEVYADAARASLGAIVDGDAVTLRVWAPTARAASVVLWAPEADGTPGTGEPTTIPLAPEPDGCWSASGAWLGWSYLYEVTVFAPGAGVVTNRATDPYSIALTVDSTRTVIVDADDPAWAPAGWRGSSAPALRHCADQVIYELHIRDFSRDDASVPAELRGTYAAFGLDSIGTRHLAELASAGLNTVQLMPFFDFASAEEDRAPQTPEDPATMASFRADSTRQQAAIRALRRPAFNWGYDPWHVMAPEGGYATPDAQDGGARIAQARGMVGALHGLGLRVVADVVFNHMNACGQGETSVLGRLVPGYYHRRDTLGRVCRSSCCPDTASERTMMAKLIVDACVHWVRAYHVDGFRFDLMSFHPRSVLMAVRGALDALTMDADGVDGSAVTLYGEGWNFGEITDDALFESARQGNLGGTGIACFNDRIRDGVRGGAPFDADPRKQGFATGRFTAPNAYLGNGPRHIALAQLLEDTDLVQSSLAGSLRHYTLTSAALAREAEAGDLPYREGLAGFADAPDEVINYVDAHDNETLFDALALKLPVGTSMSERIRVNTLCLALATWAQGSVMWHAGADVLRSKSLDRNSYASGDWFNRLDFTGADNGFGRGLPPRGDNLMAWTLMRPLLSLGRLKPSAADVASAHAAALDVLRVRSSSPLFALGDAEAIETKVSFPASGTWQQTPGVIVMLLDDSDAPCDPRWSRIVVVFNATRFPVRQEVEGLRPGRWTLHPVQAAGADDLLRAARADAGRFVVPGRCAAVFVEER